MPPPPRPAPRPQDAPQSRANFVRKLGYYLVGIAIGFVLLGAFQKLRKVEQAKREQELKAIQPSPIFPPPPKDTDPLPAQAPPTALPAASSAAAP